MPGGKHDTIVALSSGQLPSGVAIIRISGARARDVCAHFSVAVPAARFARFARLVSPIDQSILDEGLVVFFPGPCSFTGDDVVEFHLHGSRAVVEHFLRAAMQLPFLRLAEAGEFTRRAFENSKLDLTAVEGIGDLINAQTENQRALAVSRMRGGLADRVTQWRRRLTGLRAEIEARLDFSDEDDVAGDLPETFLDGVSWLKAEFADVVSRYDQGRLVREGIRVALVGRPNVGKSSLLNALAQSDVAIVSDIAGTTRDAIEIDVSIDGYLFRIVDTAGLRETDSQVEIAGMERTMRHAAQSDLVLLLTDNGDLMNDVAFDWVVATKSDLAHNRDDQGFSATVAVSTRTPDGLEALTEKLSAFAKRGDSRETLLISHTRDKVALDRALLSITRVDCLVDQPELLAEELRTCSFELERLVGLIDTEQVLDHLFSEFCIGK